MENRHKFHVVIVGGGFAGLNVAKALRDQPAIAVTLIDRSNHHLFQPLLYQVAMAGLSPAEIATPIRSIFSGSHNIEVLMDEVTEVCLETSKVVTSSREVPFHYLVLACGAKHSYFGKSEWEEHAPGLKTLEQALEIRRRVLTAFEESEKEHDLQRDKKLLTFVVVGGGPTGVELAGALAEISRFALKKDFHNIDPARARVLLVEAGPRILPTYDAQLSENATKALEKLGVDIWTSKRVTHIDQHGVQIGEEFIESATVLWAAGVQPSSLNRFFHGHLDSQGRVLVEPDLSLKDHPNVFILGDQANFSHQDGSPLPGLAPVAMQQGRCAGKNILRDLLGKSRKSFKYWDRGTMATVGRAFAVVQTTWFKFSGLFAWFTWLFIHILYLIGFKNRWLVFWQWAWSYLTYKRGARLIVSRRWKMHS